MTGVSAIVNRGPPVETRAHNLGGEQVPSAPTTRSLRTRIAATLAQHGKTILGFALLLGLWEGLVRIFQVKLYILPAPSFVLATLWTKWATIGGAAWQTA
ncbi:MAG: hypothetical protein ABI533_10240, partial [Betaproteobacteria bacterium]